MVSNELDSQKPQLATKSATKNGKFDEIVNDLRTWLYFEVTDGCPLAGDSLSSNTEEQDKNTKRPCKRRGQTLTL